MPASITAKPNPVLISRWNITGAGKTTLTWDTGNNALRGQLYLSIDGGTESLFDRGTDPNRGSRTNSNPPKTQTIELGKSYVFRLRQVNAAKTQLASTQVTAQEQLGVPQSLVDEMGRQIRRKQRIYDLRVIPGVDSVRFIFRTTQAAAPLIILTDGQREFLAPLDLNKREIHDIMVRGRSGLVQDRDHTYRIIAVALPDSLNQDGAESAGRFRTGSRTAFFFFDRIKVRNDGDHGLKGAGEFTFSFGAGNADPSGPSGTEPLSNVETYGEADISDDEPPVDVNRVVTVPFAPPRLWVQVNAFEDDDDPTSFGLGLRGMKPGFEPPGSRAIEDEDGVWASVTQHFDIGELSGVVESLFEMATGDFGIAYTVFGRLRVDSRPGTVYLRLGRAKRPTLKLAQVATLRSSGVRAVIGMDSGLAHFVMVASGGGLYHATVSENDPIRGPWQEIGEPKCGPVTVVAIAPDRIALFALDSQGSVLCQTIARNVPAKREWQCLGGSFVGSIAAAPGPEGKINLFALNKEGCVLHGIFTDSGCNPAVDNWRPLGHGVHGSLTAFVLPDNGLGLLGLDREGRILHKRQEEYTWLPSEEGWGSPGTAPPGFFSASLVDDGMVLLAVLSEDDKVHALPWRDYPDTFAAASWQIVGTIDSLLDSRMSLLERPVI